MADLTFDATITIGHHHMTAVGLDPAWHERRRQGENMAKTALVAAAAPF